MGVGRSYWPTPAGQYFIREKLTKYASPFYGPLAFGSNARSAVLTDWPGGGFIGIHGTDEPQLIPGAISHGCVRLRDPDILRAQPAAADRYAADDRVAVSIRLTGVNKRCQALNILCLSLAQHVYRS